MITISYILAIFVLVSIVTTLLGYWLHRAFHQPWSRWFYNAHMNHHQKQYPANDFLSEEYRSAGKDDTAILFGIVFAPIILSFVVMMVVGFMSVLTGLTCLISLLTCGWLHDYVHNQFHLQNSWMDQLPFFVILRQLHRIHHFNMQSNFGILMFSWDKLFNTFDC